jgi:hypothetical protein
MPWHLSHDYPPESDTSAWRGYPNDSHKGCRRYAECREPGCRKVKYIGEQHDYETIGSRRPGTDILRCRKCGDVFDYYLGGRASSGPIN